MINEINKMKNKNLMIISIDEEEIFENSLYPFIFKVANSVDMQRTYIKIIKAIYLKLASNIILNFEKLKASCSDME